MVSGLDSRQRRFVIVTGQGSGALFFNDVWAFDLISESWTQLPGQGAVPAVRYGSGGGIFDVGG